MDKTQLKHRLVGAIVLVALGVIFIPMILTTDNEFTISDTNIPAKPAELKELAEMTIPEPAPMQPKPELEAQIVDEHTADSTTVTESASATTPQVSEPLPAPVANQEKTSTALPATGEAAARAWIVQVASFTERNKALALRDRLRKAKYPCFVESVAAKNTKLYRVRVGPVVRREHAEEWQKKIAKDFKVPDALVMVHPG